MNERIIKNKETIVELLQEKRADGKYQYTYSDIIKLLGIEDTTTNRKNISDAALINDLRRKTDTRNIKNYATIENTSLSGQAVRDKFLKALEVAGLAFIEEWNKEEK